MGKPSAMSPPLVAHRGADPYTPSVGVEIGEIAHYYDGPLAGLMCGPDGAKWIFWCVRWDSGPRRVWLYAALPVGATGDAALEIIDHVSDTPGIRPVHDLVGPITLAVSDDSTVTAAIAVTADADLDAVAAAAACGAELPAGSFEIDDDVYIGSLRRTRAESAVIEAARVQLAANPDGFVATPA